MPDRTALIRRLTCDRPPVVPNRIAVILDMTRLRNGAFRLTLEEERLTARGIRRRILRPILPAIEIACRDLRVGDTCQFLGPRSTQLGCIPELRPGWAAPVAAW